MKAQSLSKAAARKLAIDEIAAAYRISSARITVADEPVLYSNISKLIRLVFPKNGHAAANLERELRAGSLSFNDALEIARGHVLARRDRNKVQPRASDPEWLQHSFAALIQAAVKEGQSNEVVEAAFTAALRQCADEDP